MFFDNYTLLFGLLILIAYLSTKQPKPDQPASVLRHQTIASKSNHRGETPVYRNTHRPHDMPLLDSIGDIGTIYHLFWAAVKKFASCDCLGTRDANGVYRYITYSTLARKVEEIGNGLLEVMNLPPTETMSMDPKRFVGIFMKNCVEWFASDVACLSYGFVSVPIHESFDDESLIYLLNHTQLPCLILSESKLELVLRKAPEARSLKYLIVGDSTSIPAETKQRAREIGISMYTLNEVQSTSKGTAKKVPPSPDDVLTICYTSGTTGSPKGAMITHRNMIGGLGGFLVFMPKELEFGPHDRHISYLPLSHMMERIIFHGLIHFGSRIGFFGGDIKNLLDDIAALKPTILVAVPRVLNRVYDGVRAKIETRPKWVQKLFAYACEQKMKLLEKGCVSKSTLWDYIVFKKVRIVLGGEIRGIVTGSAPISSEVLKFCRIAFGCFVLEGYGQTETAAAGFCSQYGDHCPPYGSHVGTPFSSLEYKLVDAPDLNYLTTDVPNPRGEICLRGPLVMKGYYKNPKKTNETIDQDGWLYTGDIGEVLPNGTLKIIDRVKNIFKLSQGEFVAPDAIESKTKIPLVAQLYIHGESMYSFLIAIAVPEPQEFLQLASSLGIKQTNMEVLCQNNRLKEHILKLLQNSGKQAGLKSFEIPKKIILEHEPFSLENGLLTPTLKTKRNRMREKYEKQLKEIYEAS